ncbi:MAG TPA: hypothetical protein VNO81_03090, partial [Candidatus Nitrosotenuis sp.]|nr:hypothetical protein [Candidatus Nitrosotenuis sp.]
MSRPGDNPLVALLQMRSRRRGHPWFRPSAWLGAGLALGLGGLGALGARWMVFGDDPSALAHTLAGAALGQIIGAAVLLLALPLTGSAIDRSLLRTLRLGRCWDEVLTGRYSLAELVDGLVRHRLAQTAWQAAGYTVAALPFCWAAGSSYLLTLLAFLPAVLLVSLWVGYFSLATVGWSEGEEGLGALQMVPLAAIFGPGAFLASIPRAGLPLGYLYSLWMSRRMALAGLARNPSPGSTERAWP